MASGYIYALANESMPGVFKVGCTSRNPFDRAKELQTTGVPTPFYVVAALYVSDIKIAEANAHALLSTEGRRLNDDREFFRTTLGHITLVFSQVVGESGTTASSQELSLTHEQVFADAKIYHFGKRNTPPDLKKAVKLYEQAVRLGSSEAARSLATIYAEGKGVRKSVEKYNYYEKRSQEIDYLRQNTYVVILNNWVSTLEQYHQDYYEEGHYGSLWDQASYQCNIEILNIIAPKMLESGFFKDKELDLYMRAPVVSFFGEPRGDVDSIIKWAANKIIDNKIPIDAAEKRFLSEINRMSSYMGKSEEEYERDEGIDEIHILAKLFSIIDPEKTLGLPYDLLERIEEKHIIDLPVLDSAISLERELEERFGISGKPKRE